MEMQLPQWLAWILCIITFLFLLLQALNKAYGSNTRLPPGPSSLPIVGSLFKLTTKPHQALAGLAKFYGPLMSVRLGCVTTIVISSPEMAKEVLHKHDQAFSGRSVPDAINVLHHPQASIVWSSAGAPHWKNLRNLCSTALFAPRRLDASQPLRRAKIQDLINQISAQSSNRSPVHIGRFAFDTMLNLISRTVFSVDMAGLNPEFNYLVRELMVLAGSPNVSDFFPFMAAIDVQGKRRRGEALVKKLYSILDEHIECRLKGGETSTHDDFLDALLNSNVERRGMTPLLAELFAAGTESSSTTVEWAMAELLRNPEKMAKANAELDVVIGPGEEVKESDIVSLRYLQAVVKETLRLHPPAPFLLPHRSERPVELCGYTVPEHTRVLVNVWAIGRDEKVWAEPEVFRPERFVEREVEFRGGGDFDFIPFGAGRRVCPGTLLAFRTVHLMLASLFRWFHWELEDGREPRDLDMTETFGVSLVMAVPLRAIALPRMESGCGPDPTA